MPYKRLSILDFPPEFLPSPRLSQHLQLLKMSINDEAPPPVTRLGRWRQLSPTAGIHVSPIQLGAMSIGDKWEKNGFGAMNKESSFKLLDAYFDAGGNFIDTANG